MADEKLNRSLKKVLERAIDEAGARGAATVEAEHLLMAIAADDALAATTVLAGAGLDYAALEAALKRERAASLAAAGIDHVDDERLAATPRPVRPRWGSSVRDTIHRGQRLGRGDGRRRPAETELLIGILNAPLGTVPRALALTGVDREQLLERATQA